MLIAIGTYKGASYEEKPITARQLMADFNIPELEPGKVATFKLIVGTDLASIDRVNGGQVRVGRSWRMDPSFTVNTPDGSLTIRYVESRIPRSGGFQYLPKKVSLVSGTLHFSIAGDALDKYVWSYLHPSNKNSPFARRPKYEYYDPEAGARAQLAVTQSIVKLQQTILTMDEQALRQRASGIAYSVGSTRYNFRTAPSMPIDQLRNTLSIRLMSAPQPFMNAWESAYNSMLGLVNMAIHNKILVQSRTKSGGILWRFGDNYGGQTIVTSERLQNPMDVLQGELRATPAFLNAIRQHLDAAVPPADAESPDMTPPPPVDDAAKGKVDSDLDIPEETNDLLNTAIDQNHVSLDYESEQVYLLKNDGSKWKPLFKVKNTDYWINETAEWLSRNPDTVKILTNRLS